MVNLDIVINILKQLVVVTAITEPVVEAIKLAVPRKLTDQQKQAVSMVVAIMLATGFGVSIFSGNILMMVVGTIISGLIASRGSNTLHSLIKLLQGLADTYKVRKISK